MLISGLIDKIGGVRLHNPLKNIVLWFILLMVSTAYIPECQKFDQKPLNNSIGSENIHSVHLFREGWEFSQPYIVLGTDQRVLLKFDVIADGATNFYYTITHCGSDWFPSRLVQSEYMVGFIENPVNDYAASVNTTIRYTNYLLSVPNENVKLLLSGNYLLSVFEEGKRDTPVLTRRFYVVEPLAEIGGTVKNSTFEGYKGQDQEIDFEIAYPRIDVKDPRTEIKVTVMQNSRRDNCITGLKPLFVRDNLSSYDLSDGNIFPGGAEFRNFDVKNLKVNGLGVQQIEFARPYYHVALQIDQLRRGENYRFENDLNGSFLIKNDRANDPDLESDYVQVHFSLDTKEPLLGGDIYVFGGLTDWECLPANKMEWEYDLKLYRATLTLKQGFYDYQYVYVEKGSGAVNSTLLEGSHLETENDYQVLVYYRGFSSRYDRLIGYRTINSVKR